MTDLAQAVEDYMSLRRSLGFKLTSHRVRLFCRDVQAALGTRPLM